MHKLKKPLLLTTGALVLVAAAVLGIISAVKTTPWELTYHIVPSDVTSMILWKGTYSSKLTDDEIISVVHLLNRLEKSSFAIKYSHSGPQPVYGVVLQCGDLEIRISQSATGRDGLFMTFDKTTAKSFLSGQWYIKNSDLKSAIDALLAARASEIPSL